MKKISLITLHSVQNYGSALQTYATQQYLSDLGFEVETVDFTRPNNLKENLIDTALKNSRLQNKNVLIRLAFRVLKTADLNKRYELFDEFIKKYIKLTPNRYLTTEDFEKHPIDADIYCTGSDQTWNTYWNRGFVKPYYLSYAKEGGRKVAYAASIGKASLDEDEKDKTKELLSAYDAITVREQGAVDILADLGIYADRILDPTLMMTGKFWRDFAEKRLVKERYMLIYQLSYNSEFDRLARAAAKRLNIRLIRIGFGIEAYAYGGKVIKNPQVREFLSLLANAEYIITDSFHATSFAANMNVRFLSWLPKNFSGRISEFLKLFKLENRIFSDEKTLRENIEKPIDFEDLNKRLDEERKRCEGVIRKMLEV